MTDRTSFSEKGYLFNPDTIINEAIWRSRDKNAAQQFAEVYQKTKDLFAEGIRDAIREFQIDPVNPDPDRYNDIIYHAAQYVADRRGDSPQDQRVINKLLEQIGGEPAVAEAEKRVEERKSTRSVGQRTRSNSGSGYLN